MNLQHFMERMVRRENVVDALPEKCACGSAEKLLGGWTDHDSARFAREENQAVFPSGHEGVHVFAHGAEDFVDAAQLLADLRDLAAHRAEFVGTGDKSLHFWSGHIELSRRDAIQLIGNAAQRSKCGAADNCGQSRGNNQREQNDRAELAQVREKFVEQETRRNRDADFTEGLTAFAEGEVEFVDFRRTGKDLRLMDKTALRQLRERSAPRK